MKNTLGGTTMTENNYNVNELQLDELTSIRGGYELTKVPDIKIGWLLGHNIRCPFCKTTDSNMIDVALAKNNSDAQCECHACGRPFKYRLLEDGIYIVI
jgi:hypothetical protein